MRLFNKFHALCTLAVCSILYSAWVLASRHYRRVIPAGSPSDFRVAPTFNRRLVVFGDSWSDNNADEIQGFVWTDWLCSLFSCHHENLAQTGKSLKGNYIGSVVDNSELDSSRTMFGLYQQPLADFKAQADQWLDTELNALRGLSAEAIHERQNNTVVAVSFGVWDLWNLIGKDYDKAKKSVERSIGSLVEQLDVLSYRWGTVDMKVILTLAVDVTFLPAFKSIADRHKDTVQIVEYWNSKLREAAEKWGNGTIYLFDTNAFMLDLIRDWQLFAAGFEEENGLGKNEDPGWENVEDPCVERGQQWVMMSEGDRCEKPEKYLFWNEMHLGPSAHRLMGTEIFHGIDEMWLRREEVTPVERSRWDSAA